MAVRLRQYGSMVFCCFALAPAAQVAPVARRLRSVMPQVPYSTCLRSYRTAHPPLAALPGRCRQGARYPAAHHGHFAAQAAAGSGFSQPPCVGNFASPRSKGGARLLTSPHRQPATHTQPASRAARRGCALRETPVTWPSPRGQEPDPWAPLCWSQPAAAGRRAALLAL